MRELVALAGKTYYCVSRDIYGEHSLMPDLMKPHPMLGDKVQLLGQEL